MFRKKQKKGISPLIATVIIIGFTIVLAAIVIQFGTGFVKRTTEGAEKSGAIKQKCTLGLAALEVQYRKNEMETPDDKNDDVIEVIIDNKNDEIIHGLIMRVYESPTKLKAVVDGDDGVITEEDGTTKVTLATYQINGFDFKKLLVSLDENGQVGSLTPREIGILPKVKAKASDPDAVTCDNEVRKGVIGIV